MADGSTGRDMTELLQLIKPRISEAVRVTDINDNSSVLDTVFGTDRNFSKLSIANDSSTATDIIPKSNSELKDGGGWSRTSAGDTLTIRLSRGLTATANSASRSVEIKHSNSITSGTVGTSHKGVKLYYDAQGHITQASQFDMFPPLEKGTDGQVWTSSGAGSDNGTWRTLSGDKGISITKDTGSLTVGHSSTYSAGEYGSSTVIPTITTDVYGHIASVVGNIVYPPDSKGTADQFWISTGSGSSASNKKPGAWATLSAGEGLYLSKSSETDGKRYSFGHTNTITAGTVGSDTSVPTITYDAQGHISKASSSVMYPPITAGTKDDIWVSSGTGRGKWVAPSNITVGNATNAVTATKLASGDVGSTTKPVHFVKGQPVEIPYTIEKSVPSDAKFTDTTYSGKDGVVLTGTVFSVDSAASDSTSTTEFVSASLLQSILAGSGKVYSSDYSLNDRMSYIENYLNTSYNPDHPSSDKTLLERMAVAEQDIDGLQSKITTAESKTALEDTTVLATHKVLTSVKKGLDSSISALGSRATALETLTSTHTTQITNLSNVVNTNMLKTASLMLEPADWKELTVTKDVSNMKTSSIVWVAFQGTGTDSAVENEVLATTQADGKLTFSCTTAPDTTIVADVVYT